MMKILKVVLVRYASRSLDDVHILVHVPSDPLFDGIIDNLSETTRALMQTRYSGTNAVNLAPNRSPTPSTIGVYDIHVMLLHRRVRHDHKTQVRAIVTKGHLT